MGGDNLSETCVSLQKNYYNEKKTHYSKDRGPRRNMSINTKGMSALELKQLGG